MNILENEETDNLMNRFEDKYSLPASKLQDFTLKLSQKLKEGDSDTSVRHNRNRTIYLDNRDLDSFRDNIEGIRPRFKVRIRQYKPANQDWEDTAYVELKIKNEDGFTKKVRIRIPAGIIPYVCEGHEIKSGDYLVNINKDISKTELWKRTLAINTVIAKYNFRKQLIVEYNRRAYSNKEVRVTIDDSLQYHNFSELEDGLIESIVNSDNWEKNYKNVKKIKNNDFFILEVKHSGKVPNWLQELMDENKAKQLKFSKYSAAVMTYMVNGCKDKDNIQRQKINTEELFRTIQTADTLYKKLEDLKESLEKGIKENILAGALAMSPMSIKDQQIPQQEHIAPVVDKKSKIKNAFLEVAKRNPILGAIGAHESSGGENLNHKTVKDRHSMHFGHTAGGPFGMMPITAAEVISKDKSLATKHPDLAMLAKDVKGNHSKITSLLNDNPEAAINLAESLFNHNKSKTHNTDELIHSWNRGLTGTYNARNAGDDIASDDYVVAVKRNLKHRAPANKEK